MTTQRPFFLVRDLGRMWGEERARKAGRDLATAQPVPDDTVTFYLKQSRPAKKPGSKPRRYINQPVPRPVYLGPDGQEVDPNGDLRGCTPYWYPNEGETLSQLEKRIRAWWHDRPGQGAGGGRPPKPRTQVACPCGCGEQVAPGTMCDRSVYERAGAEPSDRKVST